MILDFDERAVEQEVFARGFSQVSMITVYQYLVGTQLCFVGNPLINQTGSFFYLLIDVDHTGTALKTENYPL